MSLYQCEECGAMENTACGYYHTARMKKEKPICSEYHTGKWHEKFEKILLPKGEFVTDREGNLEHIKTGSTDVKKFQIGICTDE